MSVSPEPTDTDQFYQDMELDKALEVVERAAALGKVPDPFIATLIKYEQGKHRHEPR